MGLPTSPAPNPLGNLPGVGSITDLVRTIGTILGDVDTALADVSGHKFTDVVTGILKHLALFPGLAEAIPGDLYTWVADTFIGGFFTGMLEVGLGVDTSKFDPLAKQGVKTTDSMLMFAYTMPWIVAAAGLAGKVPLAGRWIEPILEPISRLPEEMGLSWALGMQIEEAYAAAVGQSIEEGIKEQKRSTRIEWPILRQAYRQHLLTKPQLQTWLAKLGYPDEQIQFIIELDAQQLGVADLQQLFLRGDMTRKDVRMYLRKLGFSESDVNYLTTLYVDRAETASGAMYRQIARQLFANDLIPETQYRQILADTNTPAKTIEDDVTAINLEKSTGHIRSSVSSLKTLYQHGGNVAGIQAELASLGYTPQAITDLFQAWDKGPLPHPMSAAKVLSYYLSGILTDKADVLARLVATHLRQADAEFLVEHPEANPRAKRRTVTPQLIVQAFLDGVIPQSDLLAKLEAAGADQQTATYMEQIALYKKAHQKAPKGPTLPLTRAEIVDAWYLGLMDESHALQELQHLGYSADDALLFLEIKNKGPIQPPAPPLFSSFSAAAAFLESLGYTLTPPPDPRIGAAEQVLATAGWTWSAPLPPPAPIEGVGTQPPSTTPGTPTSGFLP